MSGPSFEALKRFFENNAAARKATNPLHRDARVGLELASGPAHFTMQTGAPQVLDGPAESPDFTLILPDGAVSHITALESDDVGEFGVEFFKLVLSRAPETKVRIRVQATTARLLSNGYLGVLAVGGAKVGWWLLKNGVRNPKAAIDRLRGK